MQSQEGGVVAEEYRTEYVADRVNTLGRAFLGVTVECARCHDHKYDPITQKEFFQLYAFFNSVNETGQIPYSGIPSPSVMVMDDDTRAAVDALRKDIALLEAGTAPVGDEFERRFSTWLATATVPRASEPPGLIGHFPFDADQRKTERAKVDPKNPKPAEPREVVSYENLVDRAQRATAGGDKDRRPELVTGRFGGGFRLPGDSYITIGDKLAFFERNQPFSLSLWVRLDKRGVHGPLIARSGGVMNGNRGYEIILHDDGHLTAGLHHVFPDNSIEIAMRGPLAVGDWQHVGLVYDGSSHASGLRLYVNGLPAETDVVVDNLHRSILYAKQKGSWGGVPPLRLGKRQDETTEGVAYDELRVYDRQLTSFDMARLGGAGTSIEDVLARRAALSPVDRALLAEHFLLRVDPVYARALPRLTALRATVNERLTALDEVMAMRELPTPRATFVLARGAYDAPTERVGPGTPRALGAFPATLPQNRLGLARWLVSPTHPLTSRVIVNRYWAMVFGRGLVPSLADFGSQGRLPSHAALLDWLALRFIESGWNLKALQRTFVTSATYRQSSVADAERREADPANEWLSRGPSYRLSAEAIRDAALSTSGLLVSKIGGPSVYPYQPAGLWEALATRNATTYTVGKGDDLYRRGLYTVWKRSSPPPSATSFDAAERLVCTVNRQRTSTPLQALVLMNDTQYVEASRKIAERMLVEGGPTLADRVTYGFRLVTGRRPTPSELRRLEGLYGDERAEFATHPDAARKLLATGQSPRVRSLADADLAAGAVVANTLLNTDAAVMKR